MAGKSVLFRMIKGFLYGNVIGLVAGIALFLLASAVAMIAGATGAEMVVKPTHILLLVWAASVTAGVAKEYSDWLEQNETK